MFLHLLLHLQRELHHGFLHFLVTTLHVAHDGVLEVIICDTLFNKERVVQLGCLHEHIDHHFHFVHASAATLGRLALHSSLLLDLLHLHCPRSLERLESLSSRELRFWFVWICVFTRQFSLLRGHQHLSHLRVLSHHLHGHLEFLLSCLSENLEHLSHNDLTHLVLSHELLLDDVAISVPVIVLEGFAPLPDSLSSFSCTSLAACESHEVEQLECVLCV